MIPDLIEEVSRLFYIIPYFDTIVDLGCGLGPVGSVLKTRAGQLIGVDRDEYAVLYAQKQGYDETALADVLEFTPPSGALVTLFDVIEHLEKEEGIELLEKLETNKNPVLLTTPSEFFPLAEGGMHKCLWTEEELRSLGFGVRKVSAGLFEASYGKILLATRPSSLMQQGSAISVIIPVGRGDSSEHVRTTFHGADEIISVDDGVVEVAEARNMGAARAKGDIFLFTECDIDLQGLDVKMLVTEDFDIGSAFYETVHPPDQLTVNIHNTMTMVNSPWMIMGGFMWMRRYVWEALGGFRKTWWDDVDFASRAFWKGFKFGHFPVTVIHTRPYKVRLPYIETSFLWGVPSA